MDAKEQWYVYLLLCDQKTFYVGITPDIANRIRQH
ncbi:GIY-YIG nuclease family protein, partial [Candidatus Gottesmanbacteria bacterium]|nr:GIY-YIG nuclease family protein [Candidatus Gottesmanbacteria bacterium]